MDVMPVAQASPIATFCAARFRYQVKPFVPHCCLTICWFLPPRSKNLQISLHSLRVSKRQQFGESGEAKASTCKLPVKLLEILPQHVKGFQWKNAITILLQRATSLGLKALKWSFVIFVISFLSDVLVSISSNRELIIPFGLFIGCSLAALLKEISLELVRNNQEGDALRHLAYVGGFFLLVKLAFQGNLFISHVCNGALMQVLWWGKELQGVNRNELPVSNVSFSEDGYKTVG